VIADAIIIGFSSFFRIILRRFYSIRHQEHIMLMYSPPFAAIYDALVNLSSPTVICGIAQYLYGGNEHLYLLLAATDLS
jgi:hypothetical protein